MEHRQVRRSGRQFNSDCGAMPINLGRNRRWGWAVRARHAEWTRLAAFGLARWQRHRTFRRKPSLVQSPVACRSATAAANEAAAGTSHNSDCVHGTRIKVVAGLRFMRRQSLILLERLDSPGIHLWTRGNPRWQTLCSHCLYGESRVSTSQSTRIPQLDAMRGLAAATVVPWHMLLFPMVWPAGLWLNFPIPFIFIAGHAAVVLFFVLSGFVLALPFVSESQHPYRVYAWRRICRIWIPYAACVAVSMIGAAMTAGFDDPALSTWARTQWSQVPTYSDVLQHFLLIGNFDSHPYDSSIWSLVHEMRISLVFPAIAAVVMRYSAWKGLLLAGLLMLPKLAGFELNWRLRSFESSVYFSGMFVVGALLAKSHVGLRRWSSELPTLLRALLAVTGVILYTVDGWIHLLEVKLGHFNDLIITGGAAIFIVLSFSSTWLTHWLPVWLGKISYSLYLWHVPVLLATIRIGSNFVPLPILLVIGGLLSVGVAAVSQKCIEEPSIAFARRRASTAVAGEAA